jgi:hypothetical protein
VLIPLGGKSAERYSAGGGGDLLVDVARSSILSSPFGLGYSAGIEGGFLAAPVKSGDDKALSVLSGGLGAGLFYYPLSRFLVRADGTFGLYRGVAAGTGTSSWWWRAGGEAGFRFSPAFTLSLGGGYRHYNDRRTAGAAFSGLYAGLAAQITFETRNDNTGVGVELMQDEPVFPLFLPLYQRNPAGTLRIRNDESAEIRNVRVSFRAAGYTSSEYHCGSVGRIAKRRTAELPLYADFAPEVLNVTENSRILGEVVIRYTLLGREKETVRSASVQVYNRNMYRWGDAASLAAFVSPISPEVLEYAKYTTGIARTHRRSGLNQNMLFGIYLFEGLRSNGTGIRNGETKSGNDELDEVQFPFQTLAYRSGSVADVGLLLAGALEASGIRAAVLPLDSEFIVAFDLGINRDDAATAVLFNGTDKLLFLGDEVWLPVAVSAFEDGFTAAWEKAAARLDGILAGDEEAELIILEDAWASYPPAPVPPQNIRNTYAEENAVFAAADGAIKPYTDSEFGPKIAALNAEIKAAPAAALYNRLGTLNLRSGLTAEAKAAFERAAGMGSAGAMVNRGNMALLEKDLTAAEKWFGQALAAEPENPGAVRGLEQVEQAR